MIRDYYHVTIIKKEGSLLYFNKNKTLTSELFYFKTYIYKKIKTVKL